MGTPLHVALMGHNEDCVKLLLDNKCKVNIISTHTFAGTTALYNAVVEGCKNCVQLLLDHGADSQLKSDKCQSAEEFSLKYNYKELYELMMSYRFRNTKRAY